MVLFTHEEYVFPEIYDTYMQVLMILYVHLCARTRYIKDRDK